MSEMILNAIKRPWRRFQRWVRIAELRATIGGLEDDLRILEGIQGYHASSKKLIIEELEAARQTLHLITRKGGV